MRYVQAGAADIAASLYHARIPQVFGTHRVTSSLALRRPALGGQQFSVSLNEDTPRGRLVIVNSAGPQGKAEYSFVLKRSGTSWRIIYDSFLGDALSEYVFAQTQQNGSDEAAATAESRARRAAVRASERYRTLYGE